MSFLSTMEVLPYKSTKSVLFIFLEIRTFLILFSLCLQYKTYLIFKSNFDNLELIELIILELDFIFS